MKRYCEQFIVMTVALATVCMAVPAVGSDAVRLFDLGAAKSNVYEGATQVTAKSVYSSEAGFGWRHATDLAGKRAPAP